MSRLNDVDSEILHKKLQIECMEDENISVCYSDHCYIRWLEEKYENCKNELKELTGKEKKKSSCIKKLGEGMCSKCKLFTYNGLHMGKKFLCKECRGEKYVWKK